MNQRQIGGRQRLDLTHSQKREPKAVVAVSVYTWNASCITVQCNVLYTYSASCDRSLRRPSSPQWQQQHNKFCSILTSLLIARSFRFVHIQHQWHVYSHKWKETATICVRMRCFQCFLNSNPYPSIQPIPFYQIPADSQPANLLTIQHNRFDCSACQR